MLEEKILELINSRKNEVSVIVKNLNNNKWILKINENKIYKSASIIKIPIMIEVLRQIEIGKYSLNEKIIIKNKDKIDFSIINELNVLRYSILDLITLMIIISDNTATNVLINLVGYDSVNNLIEKIGLENTKLNRKMMDFEAMKEGRENTTTVIDMANILEEIYNNEILNKEYSKLALNIMKSQMHRDYIPRYLEDSIIIANKTGELNGLNHDIGIVYTGNIDYLIGVFTENGANNLENKRLIGNISKVIYDYIKIN